MVLTEKQINSDNFLSLDRSTSNKINLTEVLIENPSSTFITRANGDSLQGVGIFDQDILIVDRNSVPSHKDVVIVSLNNITMCKILDLVGHQLLSSQKNIEPIYVSPDDAFWIDGVVIHSIRAHKAHTALPPPEVT